MSKATVLLIRNVAPEYYGGGETYQLMLVEELRANDFRPVIVTSSKKLIEEARKREIIAVEAPYMRRQNWSGWRNLLLPIYLIWQLRLRKWYENIFRKYNPVTVNIQSRDDWIAATDAAKKMGIRILWTDHMDFRSWVLQNVNIKYKNWIGKKILKRIKVVEEVIFISDYERKSFERLVKPYRYNNLLTIRNGVVDRYQEYRNVVKRERSFCYVGRIVKYKGIGELIKAFKALNEVYPDIELNIYGDGEDMMKYQELAGDNECIKFYGRVDNPLSVLAENDIFVLPSYREGLSLSLLDAAMMEKKIIASDVDGNPEVVKDKVTGLLVPARNAEKLAKAMKWMLESSKKAEKLARKARELYESDFEMNKIFVEKMLPLYNVEKEKK